MELKLKTLTPLWTGGADRNSDRIRETGIIGSMRWWYEGIVRGMGGRACDITADDASARCRFQQKKNESYEQAVQRLCPACWLFGCTGWQRRFRLELEGLTPQNVFFMTSPAVRRSSGDWLRKLYGSKSIKGDRGAGAVVSEPGLWARALWGDRATMRVVPLGTDAEETLAQISFLLAIMNHWGALGAKPQNGFGQIKITDGLDSKMTQRGQQLLAALTTRGGRHPPGKFFNLASLFSHIYQIAKLERYRGTKGLVGIPSEGFDFRQHFIPCAFDIRYKSNSVNPRSGQGQDFGMRPWFRDRRGEEVAHRLFGRSDARGDDDRSASRIFVSHLYREEPDAPWRLKVWGHVPRGLCDEDGRPVSLSDVAHEVTSFVETMFPGTTLVEEFDPKEVGIR